MLETILKVLINFFEKWEVRLEKRKFEKSLGARRSACWYELTDRLEKEGKRVCAITGTKSKVEFHHVKEFHNFPELECKEENVIALTRWLHFYIAHWGNWASINRDILKWVEVLKKQIENRPK